MVNKSLQQNFKDKYRQVYNDSMISWYYAGDSKLFSNITQYINFDIDIQGTRLERYGGRAYYESR